MSIERRRFTKNPISKITKIASANNDGEENNNSDNKLTNNSLTE